MDIGWDAHCPGLTAMIEREKHQEGEAGRWEWAPQDGVNGWGDPIEYLTWRAFSEKLFTTLHAMSRGWPNRVWPRTNENEDMPIEVQSHVKSSVEVRPACRCCHFRTDQSC
jgi:hypothetical protein